jgi:hypothetical protein
MTNEEADFLTAVTDPVREYGLSRQSADDDRSEADPRLLCRSVHRLLRRPGIRISRRLGKFYEELGDELSLYTRQLAWLIARPRSADAKPGDTDPPTRLEEMEGRGEWPDLPPVSPALFDNPVATGHPVMVQWMLDAGPTEPGSGAAAALSWRALNAWTIGTGIPLEPWQGRLLRRLSSDWLAQSDKARKPGLSGADARRRTRRSDRQRDRRADQAGVPSYRRGGEKGEAGLRWDCRRRIIGLSSVERSMMRIGLALLRRPLSPGRRGRCRWSWLLAQASLSSCPAPPAPGGAFEFKGFRSGVAIDLRQLPMDKCKVNERQNTLDCTYFDETVAG